MRALILLCLLMVSLITHVGAQPGDPGGDPDNPIPISGIELLLAAGGALGARNLFNRYNRKRN